MSDEFYYSDGGKGPGVARIVSIEDGVVTLEYKAGQKWIVTTMPKDFFESDKCGWKKRPEKIK